MSSKANFMYYPDLDDPDLEPKLYRKQEFYEARNQPRPYFKNKKERYELIQKICNPDILQLQQHQIFLRNFISPQTPYNSILIFHGLGTGKTCGAVTIAEGLKETVRKYNQKIYVISTQNLAFNFQETLYDTSRESKSKFPGALQCTGSTYFIEPIPGETQDELQRRIRKIRREQEKYYRYMGYQKFANFVRKIESEYDLKDYFANAVFIIDEAHNLVSKSSISTAKLAEETKKAREALHKIFKTSQNNKLILLTATPMINEINDVIVLVNLLRANDQKKADYTPNDLGNPDSDDLLTAENLNVSQFKNFIRGYISYYRGGHPSSFPLRQDMTNYEKRKLERDLYGLPLEKKELKKNYQNLKNLKLWVCEMSPFQWYNYYKYLLLYNKNDKKLRDRKTQKLIPRYPQDSRDITKTQASNIIFPIKNDDINGLVLSSETTLDNVFNRKTIRGITQYTYKPNLVPFLDLKYISIYSAKFFELFMHIIENQGINFVYNYYVESGVVPICLMLEQNGYVRYHTGLRLDQAGKYSNTRNYLNIKVRKYRCVCGKLDKDHPPQKDLNIKDPEQPDYTNIKRHKFRQGTYLRVDGQTKEFDVHGPVLKSPENLQGELIKVMVGGRKTSEGIDLKYVRSVHIVNPWHNFNQIEQAIGRGIRFCSHSILPVDQMSVKVYKYVTIPPRESISNRNKLAISKILEPERQIVPDELILSEPEIEDLLNNPQENTNFENWPGSDEHVYARALGKDFNIKFAERLMKESAIDCSFNLPANINWPYDEQNANTRDCDYQASCAYKCDYPPKKKDLSRKELNYDTYDMYFLEPKINEALYQITTLFSKNFALTLDGILEALDNKADEEDDERYELDIIYLALNKLLGDPSQKIPPRPVLDKFDRYGYVIFKEPYYLFQPNELYDQDITLYYRQEPNASVIKNKLDLNQTAFLKPQKIKLKKKITLKKQAPEYSIGEGFLSSEVKPTSPSELKELNYVDNKMNLLRDETDPLKFASVLDFFNLAQHSYLLQTTVEDWVAGRRGKPKEEIMRYYLNNFLLACSNMIYSIKTSKTAKSSKIPEITKIPTCSKWVYNLEPNKFKLYTTKDGWVSIDETDTIFDSLEKARPKDLIPLTDRTFPETFYGYFDNTNQAKKYKFKVVNIMGQKVKKKKATDETSKKTLSTGKVCQTYKQDLVNDFYDQLVNKKSDRPVGVDMMCREIQKKLRQKHLSQSTLIYFLGPHDYPRHKILQKSQGEVSIDQANQSLYFFYLYHNVK